VSIRVTRLPDTTVARHAAKRTGVRATVMLHGAAGTWTTWTPLLATAASAGRPIAEPVLFDLPGWGDATSTTRHQATNESICALVIETLDQLGYTEWDLVGHSMGAFIALHIASLRPESVRSLRLLSPTAYAVIDAVSHPSARPRRIPAFVGLMRAMRVLAPVDGAVRALVRLLGRTGAMRVFVTPLFRHTWRVDSSAIRALGEELRPRAFVAATEAARGYDADRQWEGIACPVYATRGDHDAFTADYDLERLAALLPQLRATVIPDCGHFGNVERPEETLAALGL
jgi:pimeloyl-ACP methyl ester carboxylesterase